MLTDEDTWEVPNSMDKKLRSISGRRGCADFLKQPYSPINILMRKKLMGSDLSLESLFASARNEKNKKKKTKQKRGLVLMTCLLLFPALCKNKLGSVLLLFPSHREEKYLVL